MYDYFDPRVAIPLAIVLWLIVLTLMFRWHVKIKNRVDDFFAMRRHNRRMRKWAAGRTIYDVNTIRKPEVYYAPRRSRH